MIGRSFMNEKEKKRYNIHYETRFNILDRK